MNAAKRGGGLSSRSISRSVSLLIFFCLQILGKLGRKEEAEEEAEAEEEEEEEEEEGK